MKTVALFALCCVSLCQVTAQVIGDYDPLVIAKNYKPQFSGFVVKDGKRSREIPIRVYLPKSKTPVAISNVPLTPYRRNST